MLNSKMKTSLIHHSAFIVHHSSLLLKVEAQGELNLAVGAEADGALDGLAEQAEGLAGGRLREGLAGLAARADRVEAGRGIKVDARQGVVQRRGRAREVRRVEDVE